MAIDIARGTNLSHWLSQSKRRGQERRDFITSDDLRRIADWGFDHVRLPVDEEHLWDEQGGRDEEGWRILDNALDWADACGLKTVVDLHILRSHYFNDDNEPRLYQDPDEVRKFIGLWQQLSAHLEGRPNEKVAYELLNEPVARDPQTWNRIADGLIEAIRQRELHRSIIVGSNDFQQPRTFPHLRVPDDPNVILSFHFYYPMFITHYKAGWWKNSSLYDGPVQYPGMPIANDQLARLPEAVREQIMASGLNQHYNPDAMRDELGPVLHTRQSTGADLYCGEFGAVSTTPPDARFAWYRDIISVLEAEGIAWANWDYKGQIFGLVDQDGQSTGVIEALMGN